MNRRNFLKILGIAPFSAKLLAKLPERQKPKVSLGTLKYMPDGRVFQYVKNADAAIIHAGQAVYYDESLLSVVPVDENGWMQVRGPAFVKTACAENELVYLTII